MALRSSKNSIPASVPEVGVNVPTALTRAYMSGKPLEVAPRVADFNQRQARAFQVLRESAAKYSIRSIRLIGYMRRPSQAPGDRAHYRSVCRSNLRAKMEARCQMAGHARTAAPMVGMPPHRTCRFT